MDKIAEAKNLIELRDALVLKIKGDKALSIQTVDTSDLPTFGEGPVGDTTAIYSWQRIDSDTLDILSHNPGDGEWKIDRVKRSDTDHWAHKQVFG